MITEHSLRVEYDDGEFVVLTLHDMGPARARVFARTVYTMPDVVKIEIYEGAQLSGTKVSVIVGNAS